MARSNFMNTVKQGFAVGLGAMGAFVVYLFIGMLFFIPGFLLFMGEQKKQKKNTAVQITGIILMLIGVVLMGGLGFGLLLGDIEDMM